MPKSLGAPALLLACASFVPAAHASDAPASALDATPRDNEVFLLFGPSVSSIDFQYDDSRVSESQPLDGVSKEVLPDGLRLVVVAPRKGTEEVASELLQRLDGQAWRMLGADMTRRGYAVTPDKLNFWVHGRLWINGAEVPGGLYLAQGHQVFANNWWVANRHAMFSPRCQELRIPGAPQTAFCLRQVRWNEVDTFEIGDCMAPPEQG